MNSKFKKNNGLLAVKNWGVNDLLLDRKPPLKYSKQEIFQNYKGFDGKEIWPSLSSSGIHLVGGLASEDQYDKIVNFYKSLQEVRLLYLHSFGELVQLSLNIEQKFTFVGYDYGYFVNEYNYYSTIFHEIIFGQYQEMRSYAEFLSENFLFRSVDICNKLHKERIDLLAKGYDLEHDEQVEPIEIYI